MKIKYVIPARKNSKGLKFKNRMLFDDTFSKIPPSQYQNVILTTDDEVLIEKVAHTKITTVRRSEDLSQDTTPIKSVMKDVVKQCKLDSNTAIVMLYLTYPARPWVNVLQATNLFAAQNARSLLCAMPVKSHPYLCMYESPGHKGKQVVKHKLYRRQDYPKCFEISHFICIFKASELKRLNNNMYNKNTIFYNIPRVIDVDFAKDFTEWKND